MTQNSCCFPSKKRCTSALDAINSCPGGCGASSGKYRRMGAASLVTAAVAIANGPSHDLCEAGTAACCKNEDAHIVTLRLISPLNLRDMDNITRSALASAAAASPPVTPVTRCPPPWPWLGHTVLYI